jgi:hypothetical protein
MTAPLKPELFDSHSLAHGLRVQLKTGRRCECGSDMAIVGRGDGPHAAELTCARCRAHRAWLSHETASWISTVTSKFGAPTTPIILRRC